MELEGMSAPELRRIWLEMMRTQSASRLRRELMIPLLAYRIQEQIYGGLSANICRQLREIGESIKRGDKVETPTHHRFQPGTRLIRHWQDETHEFTLQANGYEYRGEHFSNLSEIARKITGRDGRARLFSEPSRPLRGSQKHDDRWSLSDTMRHLHPQIVRGRFGAVV